MKHVPFQKFALIVLVLWLAGCTSASTDDLAAPLPNGDITYTEHVRPIIANNCVRCHSDPPVNGAPMPLTSYEFVKNAVETRGLLDRIQRPEGAPGAMPLGGPRLPQSLIDVLIEWQLNGMVE